MDQQKHNFSELGHPYFFTGLQCKMDSGYGSTKPQPKAEAYGDMQTNMEDKILGFVQCYVDIGPYHFYS